MTGSEQVNLRSGIPDQVHLRTRLFLEKWRKQAHELSIFSGHDHDGVLRHALFCDEIEKSYLTGSEQVTLRSRISDQVNLRTQILLDKWQKQANELPIFNWHDRVGDLLQNLLCYWAKDDMINRLELLNVLLMDLKESGDQVPLKSFIKLNITEPSMAIDLLWLADNINQGTL